MDAVGCQGNSIHDEMTNDGVCGAGAFYGDDGKDDDDDDDAAWVPACVVRSHLPASYMWPKMAATARPTAPLSGLFGLFGGMRASGRSCPKAKSALRGLCREMRDSNIAISSRPFAWG